MENERWQQVERLYHAALEQDSGARAAFVAEACGSDAELRREVEGLLTYDRRAGGFIDVPALELEARAMAGSSSAESTTAEPSPVPRQIGPYRLLEPLGRGGGGEVHLALDARLDRKVAIKLLSSEFTAVDADRVRRFNQEARAVSALNHPNILTIHEIDQIDSRYYLVTEYIEGETLRQRMAQAPQKRLRVADALDIAAQVAKALAAAHAAGTIHRDIKPENVMLRRDGLVKVLDFGLAKAARPPFETQWAMLDQVSTQSGLVIGTPAYMSPEQARGEPVDHRTDIFSLGVMLYEMLCGQRPFEGATASDVIAATLISDPAPLARTIPEVPAGLQRIVSRCLEKSAGKRFQSAGDLAFALEDRSSPSIADIAAATPAPAQVKGATLARMRRFIRGHVAWLIAGVLALVALAVIWLAPYRRPTEITTARFSILPPETTIFSGPRSFAISPDGRYLAFTPRDLSGKTLLWVRPLDSLTARPLPGTEGAVAPFWSPDSRSIAFFAGGNLKRVETAGGPISVVCDVASGFHNGTWNQAGTILFEQQQEIYRVPAGGGKATGLLPVDQTRLEAASRQPCFLPDGQHFLYTVTSKHPSGSGIYVGSLDQPRGKLLVKAETHAGYSEGYLLFLRQAALMAQAFDVDRLQLDGEPFVIAERMKWQIELSAAASGSQNGVLVYLNPPRLFSLVWFDRSGKRLGAVGPPAVYSNPALSPDEKRLAVDIRDPKTGTRDLWLFDLARGTSSRFTFDRADDFGAVWSPDGSRIAFTSDRRGHRDFYQKPANGMGDEELLLESADFKNVEDWSRDGRALIYNFHSKAGQEDLWMLPLVGERKPYPILKTPLAEHQAQFSPDGRWLAYTASGDIFVRAFPQGGMHQISTDGGEQPKWRRDGKELFYIAGQQKFMAAEVTATPASFTVNTPRALFETGLFVGGRNFYVVSADGQRFLVLVPAEEGSALPLTVVMNWAAGAKQ